MGKNAWCVLKKQTESKASSSSSSRKPVCCLDTFTSLFQGFPSLQKCQIHLPVMTLGPEFLFIFLPITPIIKPFKLDWTELCLRVWRWRWRALLAPRSISVGTEEFSAIWMGVFVLESELRDKEEPVTDMLMGATQAGHRCGKYLRDCSWRRTWTVSLGEQSRRP